MDSLTETMSNTDHWALVKGYYHLLNASQNTEATLKSYDFLSSCVGIIFSHGKLLT